MVAFIVKDPERYVKLDLIDSHRLTPIVFKSPSDSHLGSSASPQRRGDLFSSRGEREGEAHTAVPGEGATRAPLIEYAFFESSIGIVCLASRNKKIIALDIRSRNLYEARKRMATVYPDGRESEQSFKTIRFFLDRYLKGEKVAFDVDIDISGETSFTQKVLEELMKIPHGQTRSYRWIGKRLGYEMAARAVGQAVKRNPILIIIPCHRVIAEGGKLGGFSSGIEIKKRLLGLEGLLKSGKGIGSVLT
jgi:O-6-methylguanine DNA methyltransferase